MATSIVIPEKERATPVADRPYRISSDEFFQMIEAEIFPPERRVYLWDGRIYEAMAKTVPHSATFANILAVFARTIPPDWSLWPENPITIAEDRAPLPDVVRVRDTPNDYARRGRHPVPADVGLVVEIAKSSVRTDTGAKLEAYARAMVPAYWVVNLITRRVMACSEPRVEDALGIYGQVTTYGPDEAVPLILDGREFARLPVADLLAPEPDA